MKHTRKVILVALILGLITVLAHATSPQEYKESLLKVGVILSENDEAQVTEWLLDKNSGYPDLAEKLLSLLNNTRPKGKTTVLDAVMGKYRIVNQKSPDDCIAPPYNPSLPVENLFRCNINMLGVYMGQLRLIISFICQ
jgi:hypothetical protein